MTRQKTFNKTFAAGALALALGLTAGSAQASDLWFHLTVNEPGENANVTVNLPLAMIETALSMIPADVSQAGTISLGEEEFDARRLRELWQSLEDSDDMTFIKVDDKDESIRVAKDNGYLTVVGTPHTDQGTAINVRMPIAVVNALLDTADEGQLNIAGALRALAAHGEGELATITDDDAHVRVWIDNFPESR